MRGEFSFFFFFFSSSLYHLFGLIGLVSFARACADLRRVRERCLLKFVDVRKNGTCELTFANRAFADFVFGSLILHFFCVNFIN